MKKNFLKILLMLVVITACIIGMTIVSNASTTKEGILPFEDVKSSYWYADAAEFCYVNGIVNGMDDHTFAPANTLTRAQFVTMLVNIEGVDVDYYSTSQFSDVKPSHWYYGAVAWAYKNGIVSGTSTTTFSPNAPINRETLARMMSLYMQKKDYYVSVDDSCLNKFTDRGTISNWAIEGMKYSVSAELISGMTSNTLEPKTTVTRAQAVRIIMLYMEKYYYNCNHYFDIATCTKSRECVYCGFKDGLPSGHTVSDTFTCKSSGTAKCTVCSSTVTTSQMPHDYAVATCGKPETCKRCSATRGKATGNHTWWAATCTNPKMCKVCYNTEGSALGHDYIPATSTTPKTCRRCKQTVGSPARWYGEGTYKVGVDIPAGEYYIKCTSDYSAYFAVCNDSNGDDIITNELFDTHHFVTIKGGQYFELSRGQFISVDGIDKLNVSSSNIGEGMYRVGVDIPAGEYKLTKTSGSIGYVVVYDNSTAYRDILTNDIFDNTDYISVSKGQYLLLSNCKATLTK